MIDTRQLYLTQSQISYITDHIFGCGNTIKITRFLQKLYETFPELRTLNVIKTYVFLNFALYDYYKCRITGDRAADQLIPEDDVIGITQSKLLKEQAKRGINHRLLKGFQVGKTVQGVSGYGNTGNAGGGKDQSNFGNPGTQGNTGYELKDKEKAIKDIFEKKKNKLELKDKDKEKRFRQSVREVMEGLILKMTDTLLDMAPTDKVIIDKVSYGREEVRNLMFNMLEPKLQRLLTSILKNDIEMYMGLLNIHHNDVLEAQAIEFFEWLVIDVEMLKQEHLQEKFADVQEQAEGICKRIIGHDVVASEIVRISSIFDLNDKFNDAND